MKDHHWPKISVVMPSFNKGAFVETALKSALDQDYPNLELIVVDGGSTDNSLEIFAKYKQCFHYFVSEKDDGDYEAINKGFAKATGEICYWLNADDVLQPNSLFIAAEVFKQCPKVDWITGKISNIDGKGYIRQVKDNAALFREDFFYGKLRTLQLESTFWRMSLWKKTDGHVDGSYAPAHDFELWCRFFNTSTLYNLNTVLGAFRRYDPETQLSRKQKIKYIKLQRHVRQKHRSNYLKYVIFFVLKYFVSLVFISRWQKKLSKMVVNAFYGDNREIDYSFNQERWIIKT